MAEIGDMEVRVIHLARAGDRRALMEAELARAGVAVTGWDAVDARDPAQSPRLAALPDSGPWGPMDLHAKACLLSHRDAVTRFLEGKASHLLVLEDDVFVAEDLGAWLKGDWWPEDAEIVKIERWCDDRLRVVLDRAARAWGGRLLRRLRTRHSGGAGYVLDRAAARRMLAADRGDLPVDHLLFNPTVSGLARSARIYQVVPALVQQGNAPSQSGAQADAGRRATLRQRLTHGRADLRAVLFLPGLLAGRRILTRIAFDKTQLARGAA